MADVHEAGMGRLYLLTAGGFVFRRDPGSLWEKRGKARCDYPLTIAAAPWDSERVFVTCSNAYLASEDGGLSFSPPVATAASVYPSNRFVFTGSTGGESPGIHLLEAGHPCRPSKVRPFPRSRARWPHSSTKPRAV